MFLFQSLSCLLCFALLYTLHETEQEAFCLQERESIESGRKMTEGKTVFILIIGQRQQTRFRQMVIHHITVNIILYSILKIGD